MKKLRMTLAASMLLFLTAIVLQSCLDDWDDKYDTLFAVGTVKVIEGKDYYFPLAVYYGIVVNIGCVTGI